MRNTDSGGNTSLSVSFSARALARSWPNGFSITTRRQGTGWPGAGGGGSASPDRLSCLTTSGKNLGGTDR